MTHLSSLTFGFTVITLTPFTLSSMFVFMNKMQWAAVATATGLLVIIIVISLYHYFSIGEQAQITDRIRSIGQDLDDIRMQYNIITNKTENLSSTLFPPG